MFYRSYTFRCTILKGDDNYYMNTYSSSIKLAIVGATGIVGRTFLKILEEFKLPISQYKLFASKKSAGQIINFMDTEYVVHELKEDSFDEGFDFALFSAGSKISEIYAPIAASKKCIVIDNSAKWRMDDNVPLIVPQVNIEDIETHKNIIANPNCSTIQAVVALFPIHKIYKIKRIIYSTYQSVSGAGVSGSKDLESGIKKYSSIIKEYELEKFPYPIFNNCIPHIDSFLPDGYTKEEQKMIDETKKILKDPDLKITATTVRIPIFNSHSESINIELEKDFEIEDIKSLLNISPGLVLEDDVSKQKYPMPILTQHKNEVYVGRIRRDHSTEKGLNMWVVADNIRKGAATNAVEILCYMITGELPVNKVLMF